MRNKFFLAFVLCTLAWGSGIGIIPDQSSLRALPNSSPASAENKCEINKAAALITHDVLSSWQSYRDADFDFVLEYPVGWQVQEVIFQSEPYLDPKAILKRLTFIGAEGMIDLDIWLSHNRDLGEWLKWYGRTRNEIPVIHPNAMIGNQPAVMYLQKGGVVDVLTTFFA